MPGMPRPLQGLVSCAPDQSETKKKSSSETQPSENDVEIQQSENDVEDIEIQNC